MLNYDSYRTGTADSPICVYEKDNETVHHILLHCSRYSDAIAGLHDTVEGVYDFAKTAWTQCYR